MHLDGELAYVRTIKLFSPLHLFTHILFCVAGTVIDCYPTAKKQVLNYKQFRADNREKHNRRMEKKLNEENQNIHAYLTGTRTSYGQADLAKEYAKNRVM